MSAIEQPAAMFGRITVWCGALRMSAVSAMKWTPQKTMYSASVLLGGPLRELEGVAAEVGELDDVLALVVVAEDDELEPSLRRAAATRSTSSFGAEFAQYSRGMSCCQ